jgi:hypothetical protein
MAWGMSLALMLLPRSPLVADEAPPSKGFWKVLAIANASWTLPAAIGGDRKGNAVVVETYDVRKVSRPGVKVDRSGGAANPDVR